MCTGAVGGGDGRMSVLVRNIRNIRRENTASQTGNSGFFCHKRQFLVKSDVICPKQATALVNQPSHVATATIPYFSSLLLSNSSVFTHSTNHTSTAYYSPGLYLPPRFSHQYNSCGPCKTPALRAQGSQNRKWHRTCLACSI